MLTGEARSRRAHRDGGDAGVDAGVDAQTADRRPDCRRDIFTMDAAPAQ
jgi:hypothetical protein